VNSYILHFSGLHKITFMVMVRKDVRQELEHIIKNQSLRLCTNDMDWLKVG